jgi:hypothetical protein
MMSMCGGEVVELTLQLGYLDVLLPNGFGALAAPRCL